MENLNKEKVWQEVLDSIKVSVSSAIFQTWLTQTHLSEVKKDDNRVKATIGCASSFVKSTVETRYHGLIQDALAKSISEKCDVNFVVKSSETTRAESKNGETEDKPLFAVDDKQAFLNNLIASRIRPAFTFDNFAVSSSNQMAWAAAEAVAKRPGESYNPLFFWGGVGVGKTHLMNSVGYHLLKNNYSTKIIFCTGEEFTNEIIEGIRNKSTSQFRNKYRKLKALLIDDIQFIAGKDSVQEEFFHTFNAVTSAGGQIILTSDQPPSAIAKLEERLRSRFEAGLIVDIAPPDFELRCAITQIKAKQKNVPLETEEIHLIAANLDTARKIEGFLKRLISESELKDMPINDELIKAILNKGGVDSEQHKVKTINPEQIIDAVCKYYSISKRAITGKARSRRIARPRQMTMYLLRNELNLAFEDIGRLLGGRDHSTAMYGVDKIQEMASEDQDVRDDLLGIKNSI